MTRRTPPRLNPEWLPTPDGIQFIIRNTSYIMPMTDVREMRDDMEEAVMLARGYDKLEDEIQNADAGDVFWLFGYYVKINNILLSGDLREEYDIEFEAVSHPIKGTVTLPQTTEVTLYREIR